MIPLVLGTVALAAYLVPLPGSMAEPWADQRHLVAALAAGAAGAVCLVWLILDLRKLAWSRAGFLDENSARHYLSRPAVKSTLELLLNNLSQTTGWELYLEPQKTRAFFRTYKPDPVQVEIWLDALPKLADGDKQA